MEKTELTLFCFSCDLRCKAKFSYFTCEPKGHTCFLVRFRVNIKDASIWVSFILW